jgi:actin-like ATPase involved in cell morphogenesis
MGYQLGIDLGTTYTAAAVCQADERHAAGADVVTLGARSATVASVMYLADDGSVLVGEAAERRALTDPDRVVREFKRRIGDEIPLMIGGRPYQAHELGARMIRWVVDLVTEREGGPPRRIAVTHPASWGPHKKDLLGRALRDVGLSVTFLAEPQAAAVSYASAERVDPGSTVAVYDLGGGTFDAAVVRKTPSGGFELLGQPEGLERLGGVDFDEAVFGHVRDSLGAALDNVDPEDPDVLSAVARLRRECVEAKEALSSDTEATIPVLLPELRTQTRITRGEFESMIRPALEQTIGALRRAVGSAGLTPADLNAVLLVGGSSRIPLVSELVSDELGRPVAVDADPKTAIAMGAALAVSAQPRTAPVRPPAAAPGRPTGPPSGQGSARGAAGVGAAGLGAAAGVGAAAYQSRPPSGPPPSRPAPPPRPPMSEPPPRPDSGVAPAAFAQGRQGGGGGYGYQEPKRRQTGLLIGIGGVLAVAAILAAVFLWPSSSNANSTGRSTDLTPSTTTAPTTQVKAPTGGSTGATRRATPRTTPRTTPPETTPETTPTTPKTTPSTPKTEPSTKPSSNAGGGTGSGDTGSGTGGTGGTGGSGTGGSGAGGSGTGTGASSSGNTGGSGASSGSAAGPGSSGSTGGTSDSGPRTGGGSSPVSNQGAARTGPQATNENAPAGATETQPRQAQSELNTGAAPSNVQQPWAQSGHYFEPADSA